MGAMSIGLSEKKILGHIELGGQISDDVGRELVTRFASKAIGDSSIAPIALRYHISHRDVCVIYTAMIEHLMPNPCIKSGGLLLVPTLFFMEPMRFEALASEILARTAELSDDDRIVKVIELSSQAAQQTWDAHTKARGPANIVIRNLGGRKSAGCATAFVIGTLVGYGLFQVLS